MGAGDDTQTASAAERLRALPAVHELASGLSAPHRLAVTVARARSTRPVSRSWPAPNPPSTFVPARANCCSPPSSPRSSAC